MPGRRTADQAISTRRPDREPNPRNDGERRATLKTMRSATVARTPSRGAAPGQIGQDRTNMTRRTLPAQGQCDKALSRAASHCGGDPFGSPINSTKLGLAASNATTHLRTRFCSWRSNKNNKDQLQSVCAVLQCQREYMCACKLKRTKGHETQSR